jgi:hypothetical protein
MRKILRNIVDSAILERRITLTGCIGRNLRNKTYTKCKNLTKRLLK